MSAQQSISLQLVQSDSVRPRDPAERDDAWRRAADRARLLSYVSLAWMLAEGALGILVGFQAHSAGVLAWAFGSAVEAAAATIVIVRFTGGNRFSERAERRAQKWVAASLLVLVPYVLYAAAAELSSGSTPTRNWIAVALLASSVVLMPALGHTKRRLGRRLSSGATSGEGTQNLLCALQGAAGLVGLLLGSAGTAAVDPAAAAVIAAIASWEGWKLWRGDECGCC